VGPRNSQNVRRGGKIKKKQGAGPVDYVDGQKKLSILQGSDNSFPALCDVNVTDSLKDLGGRERHLEGKLFGKEA